MMQARSVQVSTLVLYALTTQGMREIVRSCFDLYPARHVRVIPFLDGWAIQVLPEVSTATRRAR